MTNNSEKTYIIGEKEQKQPTDKCDDKWISLPGPHHPAFFEHTIDAPQINRLGNEPPLITQRRYERSHSASEPYRLWKTDKASIRRMDYYPDPSDCLQVERNQKITYKDSFTCGNQPQWEYKRKLDSLYKLAHPGKLLKEYVYRCPEEYLTKRNCGLLVNEQDGGCPNPMSTTLAERLCRCQDEIEDKATDDMLTDRKIWRLRFLTGEYKSFDDWR